MKQNSCEHEEQFVSSVAVIGEECMNVVWYCVLNSVF